MPQQNPLNWTQGPKEGPSGVSQAQSAQEGMGLRGWSVYEAVLRGVWVEAEGSNEHKKRALKFWLSAGH